MLVYCMNLKKIGKLLTSKFVGTGPSSYEKCLPGRGLTEVEEHCSRTLHCFNVHRPNMDLSPTRTEQTSNGMPFQTVICYSFLHEYSFDCYFRSQELNISRNSSVSY